MRGRPRGRRPTTSPRTIRMPPRSSRSRFSPVPDPNTARSAVSRRLVLNQRVFRPMMVCDRSRKPSLALPSRCCELGPRREYPRTYRSRIRDGHPANKVTVVYLGKAYEEPPPLSLLEKILTDEGLAGARLGIRRQQHHGQIPQSGIRPRRAGRAGRWRPRCQGEGDFGEGRCANRRRSQARRPTCRGRSPRSEELSHT